MVLVLLLISVNFFHFGFSLGSFSITIYILVATSFCVLMCQKEVRLIINRAPFIVYLYFVTTIMLTVLFWYTDYTFPAQTFNQTLYRAWPYFSTFSIVIFMVYLFQHKGVASLIKLINIVASIWLVLVVVQSLLYSLNQTFILDYFSSDIVNMRNGSLRMDLTPSVNIMILYNFYIVYSGKMSIKNKLPYIFLTILGVYSLVAIQQTRMYTLTVLACIALIILFDQNNKGRFIRKFYIVIIAVIFVFMSGVFDNFIASFDVSSEYGGSTIARNIALDYYLEYLNQHPMFGMAFASAEEYISVLRGPSGGAYMSDVGVIGQAVTLGIFLFPFYIITLIRFLYITRYSLKNGKYEYRILSLVMSAYIILTSATIIILDSYRCIYYPCFIAVFEYIYWDMKYHPI